MVISCAMEKWRICPKTKLPLNRKEIAEEPVAGAQNSKNKKSRGNRSLCFGLSQFDSLIHLGIKFFSERIKYSNDISSEL